MPISPANDPINGFGTLVDRLMGQTPPVVGDPALATRPAGVRPDTTQQIFPQTPRATTLAGDSLQIGNQRFGQGVGFGEIREVKAGVAITDENLQQIVAKAADLTKNNGFDEIYFLGEDKKVYVLFAEKSRFQDVRVGYLGRANVGGKMQSVEVLHVEDENNTFYQGMTSTWRWLQNVLLSSFGNEASKSVSGLVTTAVGSFVAAAALKGSAPAAAPVAGAAAGGFLKTVGGAFGSAVHGFLQTMASVVLFGVGAVGVVSIFTGVKGHFRKGDKMTIDMITGQY
jgi:hypothetical protein